VDWYNKTKQANVQHIKKPTKGTKGQHYNIKIIKMTHKSG